MKRYLLSLLCLYLSGAVMATTPKNPVHYQMRFKVNNMFCAAHLNGVYLINSQELAQTKMTGGIPQLVTLAEPISGIVDEGENILTVKVHNIAIYVDSPKNSYCEVSIHALVKNPDSGEIEDKEVNHIRFTYAKNDDEESPYQYKMLTSESHTDIDPLLAEEQISIKEIEPILDGDDKPIQTVIAERGFNVHHRQPYSWVHQATVFTDTEENRELLWQKYQEIAEVIANKDKKAFRALTEPGLTDSASAQGHQDVDAYFDIVFDQAIAPIFDLNPRTHHFNYLPMDEFDLEIYAGGKLFRFNEHNIALASPLQWQLGRRRSYTLYNPLFTFIDGKIVMATFP